MSKFQTTKEKQSEINTSALPDIIFLLLFFFMMSATIRPQESPLEIEEPRAQSLTKAESRELIKELHVGFPKDGNPVATIVSEKGYLKTEDIAQWVVEQRSNLPENLQPQMIILIRADTHVKMGLIADLQEELRKANARKVLYRALPETGN